MCVCTGAELQDMICGGPGLSSQLLRKLRQEDGKSKACLGYRVSSRTAWATQKNPILKKKKEKETRNRVSLHNLDGLKLAF